MSEQNNNWERGVLEKLALSAIQAAPGAPLEYFFKVLTFGYCVFCYFFMGWIGK
jgi:hypothetical protein